MNQMISRTIDPAWQSVCKVVGIAAWLQLGTTLVIILAASLLGIKPSSAVDYFTMYQENRFLGILQDDFTSIFVIGLYIFTFYGLYGALKAVQPAWITFATIIGYVSITVCFATHSGLSMLHLSDQYMAASTEAQKAQLLAAGEAVIASDMWNSTGALAAGILMQGAGFILSLIMLRSNGFKKITAYAGILANGLDLAQHIITGILPGLGEILLITAGPFYLVWFPLLGIDFFRLGRNKKKHRPITTD